jgi:hypothetical protein
MVITTTVVRSGTWRDIAGASGFTANVLLNLYATIFISTRLLLHRQRIIANLGNSALTVQHIYIVGILLESAAINLPVTGRENLRLRGWWK